MRQTNRDRAQALLEDGRWRCITAIAEVAGRESARTRMSELARLHGRKAVRGSGCHDIRIRGKARYATDSRPVYDSDGDYLHSLTWWRDTSRDDDVRRRIALQVKTIRQGFERGHAGGWLPVRIDGLTVIAYNRQQVALFADCELERRAFEAWSEGAL